MNSRIDVLVVGAGPTGLTTAIELARRRINVRIVERRAEPSTTSKALVVHARTLELLDLIEVADELVGKGYTSPGIDFSSSADRPLRADMHKLGHKTRFPFILILPQAETEAALEQRLNREGVFVERRQELKSFSESGASVRATVESDDGTTENIDARFIVGADGPHSKVRETLGLEFEGSKYGWTAFLGDVTLGGHEAEGGTEQHANDRGLAFVVPFEDGTHRIVTIDSKYQSENQRKDLSLPELQESISAILEKPVTLSDPKWLTRWGADLRLVEAYGRGPAFLAGDSAHTHSPAGGQGMNTGIQDAFDLGWRLASVVHGDAAESILEQYRAERLAVGKQVLRVSDLLLRSLLLRNPIPRKLREIVFRFLVPLPPVQRKMAMNLSGLGIEYSGGVGEAGKRLPDVQLRRADHSPARLYELLRPGKALLLIYVDPVQASEQKAAIQDLLRSAKDRPVQAYLVLRNGVPEQHRFDHAASLVDYLGEFEIRIGSKAPRVLLVRPDGYIGLDLSKIDARLFAHSFDAWMQGRVVSTGPGASSWPALGAAALSALAAGAIAFQLKNRKR